MDKLILKPGREKSLKRRHPWVFSGAVAKVQGSPGPGDTVGVWSASGEFLAVAAYSPESQIVARVWDFEERAVDAAFFGERIERAVGQRRALMGAAGAMRLGAAHAPPPRLPEAARLGRRGLAHGARAAGGPLRRAALGPRPRRPRRGAVAARPGAAGAGARARARGVVGHGGGSRISVNKVLELLEKILGRPLQIERIEKQHGDVSHTYADTTRAVQELGFAPKIPLERGLAAEAGWVIENQGLLGVAN